MGECGGACPMGWGQSPITHYANTRQGMGDVYPEVVPVMTCHANTDTSLAVHVALPWGGMS